jgi:allantoicase
MFPDGGIARLRVHGVVLPALSNPDPRGARDGTVDLAAATNGGMAVGHSDAHYGSASNLVAPGDARNMGEGWETARKPDRPPIVPAPEPPEEGGRAGGRRDRWRDWAVLALGVAGRVERIVVDTKHFKGNFPETCLVEGVSRPDLRGAHPRVARAALCGPGSAGVPWRVLARRTRLGPDRPHELRAAHSDPVTHVRLTIFPDGGVSRLRVYGRPVGSVGSVGNGVAGSGTGSGP